MNPVKTSNRTVRNNSPPPPRGRQVAGLVVVAGGGWWLAGGWAGGWWLAGGWLVAGWVKYLVSIPASDGPAALANEHIPLCGTGTDSGLRRSSSTCK